ncbi:4-(cytidine 5'-diphospho)-2-C-methyl-D-erythritol kinase [Desulfogranum mediterraneum]|uniref:4-(cytidine 5'-diphospho)-2-C-methyl-D-erythritol kinase n=1 Tax=Desulfogranum mediterraneum TaxID=160661 RepID=UPI00041A76D2|nr:4-(cytidine 5'-diphospho)-2-C-methyl-D-erythritol kinase [Desulfogranum mediterraneum]
MRAPLGSLVLRAPAKVNLLLKVTGRRADGYHTIESLMQKVSLYDRLELRLVEQWGVRLRCPGSELAEDESNLVFQAARLFLDRGTSSATAVAPGVEITLEKRIPVAAGLGGGSSDAAATLAGLNRLHGGLFSAEELAAMGLQLGADVPFFLATSGACWASGIGELLTPVETVLGVVFVLVNPGVSVSTKWVYDTFSLTGKGKGINLTNSRIELLRQRWGNRVAGQLPAGTDLENDLQQVTAGRYAEVGRIRQELVGLGASVALMSGSGPTVFGVFTDRQQAERCCQVLKERYSATFLAEAVDFDGLAAEDTDTGMQ